MAFRLVGIVYQLKIFLVYFVYNITKIIIFNLSNFFFIKVNTSRIEHLSKQKYEPIMEFS